MGNKINRLMENPDMIETMKENARKAARPHAAGQVLDIISKALEGEAL